MIVPSIGWLPLLCDRHLLRTDDNDIGNEINEYGQENIRQIIQQAFFWLGTISSRGRIVLLVQLRCFARIPSGDHDGQ